MEYAHDKRVERSQSAKYYLDMWTKGWRSEIGGAAHTLHSSCPLSCTFLVWMLSSFSPLRKCKQLRCEEPVAEWCPAVVLTPRWDSRRWWKLVLQVSCVSWSSTIKLKGGSPCLQVTLLWFSIQVKLLSLGASSTCGEQDSEDLMKALGSTIWIVDYLKAFFSLLATWPLYNMLYTICWTVCWRQHRSKISCDYSPAGIVS